MWLPCRSWAVMTFLAAPSSPRSGSSERTARAGWLEARTAQTAPRGRRKQPRGRALALQVNEWLSESRHLSPNYRTWALSSHRPPHAEAKAPGTPGTRPPDETHQPGPRAGAPQGLELFRHLGGEGLKVAPGVLLIADPAGDHGP